MKKLLLLFLVLSLLYWFTNAEPELIESSRGVSILDSFLARAKEKDLITEEQHDKLLQLALDEFQQTQTRYTDDVDATNDETSSESQSVFAKMYNKLTFLNVLYFSGSLLIIGAYSLFMTLAFEHLANRRWADIIALQAAGFGGVGLLVWNTEYQFLGGLLLSVSTGMIPYTVYCYQRAFNLFGNEDPGSFVDFRIYVRSQWVYMELAAIGVGALYLYLAPFPFLLAPVSFALWFLSMDVAPLYAGFNMSTAFDVRRYISIMFGLGMIVLGRVLEWTLGSDPDFGFWLYLFGLVTFWFAVISKSSGDIMAHTVFFLMNVSLVLIGSHLDRATFSLFGSAGVCLTVASYFKRDRIETTFLLWMIKAVAAVSLLANAIRTGGSVEILNGAVCFVLFNVEGIVFIHKNEMYNLLILVTNLGFVSTLPAFERPLNLWLLEIPSAGITMSICSIAVAIFHLKILQYWPRRFNLNSQEIMFLSYRIILNVVVTLVMVFLQQHWWSWVGAIGISAIAMLTQPQSYSDRDGVTAATMVSQYLLVLLSIIVATFIGSNLLYLISCVCMLYTVIVYVGWDDYRSRLSCFLAVCLIVLSVPLQSKFMTSIGGIYIFLYLSHLAYTVFKKSLLFPLALIGLGMGLIGVGVVYQAYQDDLYNLSLSLIPVNRFFEFNKYIFSINWYDLYLRDITFASMMREPWILLTWLMWPGPMVLSMSKERIPLAGVVCSAVVGVVILVTSYMKSVKKYCPDLSSKVKISSFEMKLDQAAGSGIIVKITGTKPKGLTEPPYISLGLSGDTFWNTMNRKFGPVPVTLARSAFLPYQLTPSLIKFTGFDSKSTSFRAVIELGTGKQGKPSISHDTIRSNCRKIIQNQHHCPVTCILVYSTAFYLPNSPLCSYDTSVNAMYGMLE